MDGRSRYRVHHHWIYFGRRCVQCARLLFDERWDVSFFGKLIKATVDTVLLPVEVVKDVITLGGVVNDEPEPYTLTGVKEVVKDLKEAGEDAGEGDWL